MKTPADNGIAKKVAKASLPVIFGASALLAGWVQAAPGGPHEARFPIDLAALEAKAQARFERLDADQSGAIEAGEFEAAKPAHDRPRQHKRMAGHKKPGMGRGGKQRNSNRRMGEAGREAVQTELFAILDADSDGNLSKQEFANSDRQTRALAMKRATFKHLDTNQDNVLVVSEMPNPADRLRNADSDGDGQVSKAEMQTHRQAMRKAHQASKAG